MQDLTPKINDEGLALIKNAEGLRLKAYRCPAGVWTIGYGSTGPHVKAGTVITRETAEEMLRADVEGFEQVVASAVSAPLSSNQFSALVSFAYNVGSRKFRDSTLLWKLNRKDYAGAAEEFKKWVRGGGKVLPGLVKRRQAERALFLKPDNKEQQL